MLTILYLPSQIHSDSSQLCWVPLDTKPFPTASSGFITLQLRVGVSQWAGYLRKGAGRDQDRCSHFTPLSVYLPPLKALAPSRQPLSQSCLFSGAGNIFPFLPSSALELVMISQSPSGLHHVLLYLCIGLSNYGKIPWWLRR